MQIFSHYIDPANELYSRATHKTMFSIFYILLLPKERHFRHVSFSYCNKVPDGISRSAFDLGPWYYKILN